MGGSWRVRGPGVDDRAWAGSTLMIIIKVGKFERFETSISLVADETRMS